MPFDFPSGVPVGTVIPGPSGAGYRWDGTKWVLEAAVNGPFLPLSGGTVTGPTTFNANVSVNAQVQASVFFTGSNTWSPANTALQPIIDSRGNLAGVVNGTSSLQRFSVSSDTMDARLGDNACYSDLGIYHNVAGTTVNGGRQTIWAQLNVGALAAPSLQMNGINSSIFVTGDTNGAFCQPLSTHVNLVSGGKSGSTGNEFIVIAPAGSLPGDKYFLQLTYGVGDAVAGSGGSVNANTMLRFANSNSSGSPGAGMVFGLGNEGQGFPVSPTGTILGVTAQIANQGFGRNIHFVAPQCAHGIDLSRVNFTADAFRASGFKVGSTGAVSVANAVLGPTANGVSLTMPNQIVTAAAVAAGGGGGGAGLNDYYVGDILFDANGGQYRVATVTAGAVATVTVLTPGIAVSPPANPVATTGGSGISCTLNLTWAVRDRVTLSSSQVYVDNPDPATTPVDVFNLSRGGTRVSFFNHRAGAVYWGADGLDLEIRPNNTTTFFGLSGPPALQVLNQASPTGYLQMGGFTGSGGYIAAAGGGAQILHLQGGNAGGVKFDDIVGFNNTNPIAKPTVTGAKGGNAAVASILAALAAYGLVTDSTSA